MQMMILNNNIMIKKKIIYIYIILYYFKHSIQIYMTYMYIINIDGKLRVGLNKIFECIVVQ